MAFSTDATTLTPDDNNAASDVFVHDLQTGVTKRVSVATYGVEGNAGSDAPALSADGRFVAFSSVASNLISGDTNADAPIRVGGVNGGDIFVHDRQTGETRRLSVPPTLEPRSGSCAHVHGATS